MSNVTPKSDFDQELINNLEQIIKNIRTGKIYEDTDKQWLLENTKYYVTGEQTVMDPEIMTSLFVGWFLRNNPIGLGNRTDKD